MRYGKFQLALVTLLAAAASGAAMGAGRQFAPGFGMAGNPHERSAAMARPGHFRGVAPVGGFHHHRRHVIVLFVGVPVFSADPPAAVDPDVSEPTWYYCDDPKGYYPQVDACPGGWTAVVAPRPPE